MCTVAYPAVNQEQLDYIKKRFVGVISTMVDPAEIIQRAHVDRPAMRYARLIRRKYNEQGAKMLPTGSKTDNLFHE